MEKIKIVVILLMMSFLSASSALGQSAPAGDSNEAIVLATVNVYDAKIVSQDNNKLKISFDISNREKVQPGVRYAIELVQTKGEIQDIIDKKVYNEVFDLGTGETIQGC
jgi:hypothetical protein